jgi:hypothetical protein
LVASNNVLFDLENVTAHVDVVESMAGFVGSMQGHIGWLASAISTQILDKVEIFQQRCVDAHIIYLTFTKHSIRVPPLRVPVVPDDQIQLPVKRSPPAQAQEAKRATECFSGNAVFQVFHAEENGSVESVKCKLAHGVQVYTSWTDCLSERCQWLHGIFLVSGDRE